MNNVSVPARWPAAGCLLAALACCIGGCPVSPSPPVNQIPPMIANALAEGQLAEGRAETVAISASATDPDGTVMSVVADLTQIGGQPARALEPGADNVWTWTGTVTPPTSGTRQVSLTATDTQGLSVTVSLEVTVAAGNIPPQITNLAAAGSLAQNQESSLTLSVHVTDADGTVQEVTVDLSEIGGDTAQPLTLDSGDLWTFTGTVTPTVGGSRTIAFTAIDDKDGITDAATKVSVARTIALNGPPVVLAVDGLADNRKITPGAGLVLNGLTRVQVLMREEVTSGQTTLEITAGAGKVSLWSDAGKTHAIALPWTWTFPDDKLPAAVYVEGLTLSEAAQDVELTVTYDDPQVVIQADSLSDSLRFTIVDVHRNALGHDTDLASMSIGKVYIPTRYGGKLTVSGASVQLIYTDGADLQASNAGAIFQGGLDDSVVAEGDPCSWTVPEGTTGWCYIRPMQGTSATIHSEFVEEGHASYRPWNGWWWPFRSSSGPTLYDPGGPFDKYDQVYGTSTQAWAAQHEAYGDSWFGHCWGSAIASILLPEPKATSKNGVSFTADDMKGLYTDLANNDPYVDQGLSVAYIPAMPCTGKLGEDVDKYCDDLYRILRTCVRQDSVPVLSDMRARANPPDRVNEVWNQAIYRYSASFREASGANNERLVVIDMEVGSNFGPWPPPTTNTSDRVEHFTYQLEFDASGQVIPEAPSQNWISASYYPPHDLFRVTGAPWVSNNPNLSKANVDALYQP